MVSRAGKSAPRLIHDLLDYDLRKSAKTGKHILIDPAPIYNGKYVDRGSNCQHKLLMKDRQMATLHPQEELNPTTICKIAAYCSICRYHFMVTVDFQDCIDGQSPCTLEDLENPLHHFRVVDSRWSKNLKDAYKSMEHEFACTAAKCPVKVEVKILPARLSTDMVSLLTNPQDIMVRGQNAIKEDPIRFAGQRPLYPIQVLGNLLTYLQDAGGEVKKQIAKRNKRLRLAFGDDCDSLLKYLGFELKLEQSPQPDV